MGSTVWLRRSVVIGWPLRWRLIRLTRGVAELALENREGQLGLNVLTREGAYEASAP